MAKKTKSFDCVQMKRQAQERLMKEYEARKSEFPSYWQFLESMGKKSPWQSKFLGRLKSAKKERSAAR